MCVVWCISLFLLSSRCLSLSLSSLFWLLRGRRRRRRTLLVREARAAHSLSLSEQTRYAALKANISQCLRPKFSDLVTLSDPRVHFHSQRQVRPPSRPFLGEFRPHSAPRSNRCRPPFALSEPLFVLPSFRAAFAAPEDVVFFGDPG